MSVSTILISCVILVVFAGLICEIQLMFKDKIIHRLEQNNDGLSKLAYEALDDFKIAYELLEERLGANEDIEELIKEKRIENEKGKL